MQVLPLMAITVKEDELRALSADAEVKLIWADKLSAPDLNGTVPLIGMNAAWADGATGGRYDRRDP